MHDFVDSLVWAATGLKQSLPSHPTCAPILSVTYNYVPLSSSFHILEFLYFSFTFIFFVSFLVGFIPAKSLVGSCLFFFFFLVRFASSGKGEGLENTPAKQGLETNHVTHDLNVSSYNWSICTTRGAIGAGKNGK